MKKILLLFATLVLISAFCLNALAQGGESAKITGKVTDNTTGESLIGTNVSIEGTSYGTASDLNGDYVLPNIPAGTYNIKIGYIGYKGVVQSVELKSGETLELNITLEPESFMGEEVVVTAMARGQMAAMNQERASSSITNIVASDRIREVPDVNAAESIGRLPGVSLKRSGGEGNKIVVRGLSPQYTIVQIDGVRLTGVDLDRSVGLSGITSEMLDGIELSKSLTADMDADAIGGIVNLRTRVADKGFHFDVLAQGGYNSLDKNLGNYKFTAGVGNRFFEDKFGVLLNVGTEQVIRSNDSFNAGYDAVPTASRGDSLKSRSASIREQKAIRNRKFGSLVLDYQTDFISNSTIR